RLLCLRQPVDARSSARLRNQKSQFYLPMGSPSGRRTGRNEAFTRRRCSGFRQSLCARYDPALVSPRNIKRKLRRINCLEEYLSQGSTRSLLVLCQLRGGADRRKSKQYEPFLPESKPTLWSKVSTLLTSRFLVSLFSPAKLAENADFSLR